MFVLLIQGLTTPGYDPVRQTISELGSGLGGTGIVGLYGFIVLILVCPQVRAVPGRLAVGLWVTALFLIGLGCIGLNRTSPESWPWSTMGWQGRLHLIFAFVFVFGCIPIACFAAARALPGAWRALRAYSFITGFATLSLFIATMVGLGTSPPNAFATSHLGLIERAYVFAFMIWQCIVSWRIARSTLIKERS